MSLRFEHLSLQNFGPYREIRDLDLATSPDAPIVLIHGENTLGKTSLFRALRWCLYGSPEAGTTPAQAARHLAGYMNRPAAAAGETEMKVSISFTADGHKYQLSRTSAFDGSAAPRLSADLRVDAEVVQKGSIDAEIGRLLHPQISEFFLFDGELLRDFYDRLNTDRERDLLKRSIENVLGIPALQLAERDVSVLAEDAMQRQAKALKSAKDVENARRQLRDLKSKQESLEKDRSEVEASLISARSNLESVRDRIASVEELKADAREMEGLEAQIEGGRQEEARLRREMHELIAKGWLAPVAWRLKEALRHVQERNDASEQRQKSLRAARERVDVLHHQIEGGRCPTCNQELPVAEQSTRDELSRAELDLEQLELEAGAGPDFQLERRIQALLDLTAIPLYRDRQERLDALLAQQFERNRRLTVIKARMQDNDAAKIRQLGAEQDTLEAAVQSFEDRLRSFKPAQDQLNAQQDKLASTLRRLGGSQPTVAAEALFFDYVRTLLGRTISRYQERTRSEVERSASETFVKLIRDPQGYRGLRIGADYRVELIGEHGEPMKTSEGGKQLVALSLIGALKRAAVRGGPVVLDSPLARLDLEHRENVLKTWVPSLGNQAILLVQSGELTEQQASDIVGDRIGHQYRIFRPGGNPELASIERTK